MKKAKSLQRFWAFLLVFVLVATTLGNDRMTVNAAEVQSVTEEAGEPESNTIEDKTGEETPQHLHQILWKMRKSRKSRKERRLLTRELWIRQKILQIPA